MTVLGEMKENDEPRPTDLGEMSPHECVIVWKMLLTDEVLELASIES